MINCTIISNLGGLADHHPHAMIDKYPSPQPGTRVNFNTGEHAAKVRYESCSGCPLPLPETRSKCVKDQGVDTRIAKQNLKFGPCSRIFFKNGLYRLA